MFGKPMPPRLFEPLSQFLQRWLALALKFLPSCRQALKVGLRFIRMVQIECDAPVNLSQRQRWKILRIVSGEAPSRNAKINEARDTRLPAR
jgi:hypothetical protein